MNLFIRAFASLIRLTKQHSTLVSGIITGVLVTLLAYGVWTYYKVRTLPYMVEQVNLAIAEKNLPLLNEFFHEGTVVDELLRHVSSSSEGRRALVALAQKDSKGQVSLLHYKSSLLKALHDLLLEETKSPPPKPTTLFNRFVGYKGPTFETLLLPKPLPGNLYEQLVARPFTVQVLSGTTAIISTTLIDPSYPAPMTLRLLAREMPQGWRLLGVANMKDLVARYLNATQNYAKERENLFHAHNERVKKSMQEHCHVTLCRVLVNTIHEGQLNLIVHIDGENKGKATMMSAGFSITIYNEHMDKLITFPLGINTRIAPGQNFRQTYHLDVNVPPALAKNLAQGQELRTTWELTSVALNNRLFLFPRPLSELRGNTQ